MIFSHVAHFLRFPQPEKQLKGRSTNFLQGAAQSLITTLCLVRHRFYDIASRSTSCAAIAHSYFSRCDVTRSLVAQPFLGTGLYPFDCGFIDAYSLTISVDGVGC